MEKIEQMKMTCLKCSDKYIDCRNYIYCNFGKMRYIAHRKRYEGVPDWCPKMNVVKKKEVASMAKDYGLQECFDSIRALIDYDFIKNQKEYAIHLLKISKNDKNQKAWEEDFKEKYKKFKATFSEVIKQAQIYMHDDDEFIRLLNSKYESGYFRGYNAGLRMVAEGMLKSLKKLE